MEKGSQVSGLQDITGKSDHQASAEDSSWLADRVFPQCAHLVSPSCCVLTWSLLGAQASLMFLPLLIRTPVWVMASRQEF